MKRIILAVSLVSLASLTGCGKIKEKIAEKIAEKAIEKATGAEDVDLNSSSGGVTIKNAEGEVFQSGKGTKVPADWPSDVPVYPGSTVFSAVSTPKQKFVHLQTKDSPDTVVTFYKGKLAGEKTHEMSMNETRAVTFKDGKRVTSVIVGEPDRKTKVAVIQLTVSES
jgi:hypothetical protein